MITSCGRQGGTRRITRACTWLDSSGKPVISGKNGTTMITVGVSDTATAMKLDMIAASLASVGTSRDEHKG